ncbi:MAG: hypothetical protein G8D28_03710 [gamma proteobacterium symbiont of Phacoides pectinatus]
MEIKSPLHNLRPLATLDSASSNRRIAEPDGAGDATPHPLDLKKRTFVVRSSQDRRLGERRTLQIDVMLCTRSGQDRRRTIRRKEDRERLHRQQVGVRPRGISIKV